MKRRVAILLFITLGSLLTSPFIHAQCSICTKSVQQMGERPAKALNAGILYLAFTPLAIFGYIGYRWWKSNQEEN